MHITIDMDNTFLAWVLTHYVDNEQKFNLAWLIVKFTHFNLKLLNVFPVTQRFGQQCIYVKHVTTGVP